jgi:hypothetical protein
MRSGRYVLLTLLCCVALLTGCGASADSNSAVSSSADSVHQAWIDAVRAGDIDAALALIDPELPQRDVFARDAVTRMQDYMTNAASPTGSLQSVEVEPVSGNEGRSVWQFVQKRWCYRAELINRDDQWFVSRWGQTSVNCP